MTGATNPEAPTVVTITKKEAKAPTVQSAPKETSSTLSRPAKAASSLIQKSSIQSRFGRGGEIVNSSFYVNRYLTAQGGGSGGLPCQWWNLIRKKIIPIIF